MRKRTCVSKTLPFRLAMGVCLAGLTAMTAIAQLPAQTSVAMGSEIRFRLTADVNPETVKISVVPQRIARARLDTDKNRFVIEGVEQGVARITFSGTTRLIAVAGPNERGKPFRHVVDITVLPPSVRTDSRLHRYDVSKGDKKDLKLEVLMGMAFSKLNEQGYRWRNVFLSDGNTNVARGSFDPNELMVHISGIDHGRTTLVLRGERSEEGNGVWQPVVCEIRVKVGTGLGPVDDEPISDATPDEDAKPNKQTSNNDPQTSEAARDTFVESIKQRYERLSAAAQAATDANKRQAVAKELSDLVEYLNTQVENEEKRRPPSGERIAKLGDLIDLAKQDISSLEKSAASPAGGSIGEIWSAQIKAGEPTSKTCPPNPRHEFAGARTVYFASGKYFSLSPVCLAAVHSGKFTFESGGEVSWVVADITQADAQASIAQGAQMRNGVAAQVWGGSCSKCGFVVQK